MQEEIKKLLTTTEETGVLKERSRVVDILTKELNSKKTNADEKLLIIGLLIKINIKSN